jgi:4-amino-4-deoxy-L-arabinose transferase-like glycosyltransferase
MMKSYSKVVLLLILVLTFALRIWRVGQIPTFISDEASIGYNAYSILKTGRDEWGKLLPLSFKSFGEFKLPIYIYVAVPSIAILGLTEAAVRLPSVIAGVASVYLIFLLARRLFGEKVGLLSALFLAINPWHFGVSRMALEANLGLAFVLTGACFLLEAEKKKKSLFLSFFFFVLSFYTYNSCRVFVPLFLFVYFLIQRKTWFPRLKKNWLALAMVVILLLPIFISGFQGSSQRLAKVGIFADPGIINRLEQERTSCLAGNSLLWCQLLHNRPLTYSQVFVKNYLSHFSQKYLFLKGSGLAQYSVPERGALYLFELPLLILGLIFLFQEKKKKAFSLLVLWVTTAPIANSLTGEAHPVRALVLLPVFPILSALGISFAFSIIKRRGAETLLSIFLAAMVLLSCLSYLTTYFVDYPQKPGSTWQEGYKSLYQKLYARDKDFDKVVVTKFYGEPHIFYLFYQKFDPQTYQENREVIRYERSDGWVNVDRIGEYYFVQDGREIGGKVLYALTPRETSEDLEILDRIIWANGEISFVIAKVK